MLWIIQILKDEHGWEGFHQALISMEIDYQFIRVVPFYNVLLPPDFDSHTQNLEDVVEPEIDNSKPIYVNGFMTLGKIARIKDWKPGTFLNDNFDYNKWKDGFGADNLLNDEAMVGPVKDLNHCNFETVFVRPIHDTKAIPGTVMARDEYLGWRNMICQIVKEEFSPLTADTEILVSPTKEIFKEYRIFVVDGKVITGSQYKIGQVVDYKPCIDDNVLAFAQEMADKWNPADAYVLDIADTPYGNKVIEINNINSAGYYAANPGLIIDAIERLGEKYE